jgi:hypothetical protein
MSITAVLICATDSDHQVVREEEGRCFEDLGCAGNPRGRLEERPRVN